MYSIDCKNNICATPKRVASSKKLNWQRQQKLSLSNWKLCVLLLQFLINFKRIAGEEQGEKVRGGVLLLYWPLICGNGK